jgi:hypothetical protein
MRPLRAGRADGVADLALVPYAGVADLKAAGQVHEHHAAGRVSPGAGDAAAVGFFGVINVGRAAGKPFEPSFRARICCLRPRRSEDIGQTA